MLLSQKRPIKNIFEKDKKSMRSSDLMAMSVEKETEKLDLHGSPFCFCCDLGCSLKTPRFSRVYCISIRMNQLDGKKGCFAQREKSPSQGPRDSIQVNRSICLWSELG